MMAAAHGFENGVAVEPGSKEAGESALTAEETGAGIGSARAALVAIGVADNTDSEALLKRIPHDPLEGAPV